MDPTVIRLARISRSFPPDVSALCNVDVAIHVGDFAAITGPSGSGKSTLLNIIGLLDRPTSGDYWLDGIDTSELKDRRLSQLRGRTIGFVFQAFHLVSHLTVLENVVLGLEYAGLGAGAGSLRAHEALEAMAMTHRLDAFPATLSGGELQRVAIARALARSPRLLLCDEPTGNLDSRNTEILLDLLEATHSADRALVVVTHDPNVASRARRTFQMVDGRLTELELGP